MIPYRKKRYREMYQVTTFAFETPAYYPISTINALSSFRKYKNKSAIVIKLYGIPLHPILPEIIQAIIIYVQYIQLYLFRIKRKIILFENIECTYNYYMSHS